MTQILDPDRIVEAVAQSVDRYISPQDKMLGKTEDHYFGVGRDALRNILVGMAAAGLAVPQRILDLPCGHGRELRFLREAFPDAEITACDIVSDGVEFCASRFGAHPLQRIEDFDALETAGEFDLAWCGSLLTHLDAERWPALFRYFYRALRHGGLLQFTTNGRYLASRMRKGLQDYGVGIAGSKTILAGYERKGFGYVSYPDQENYGFSLTSASWLHERVADSGAFQVVGYHEFGWDRHQDVISLVRL